MDSNNLLKQLLMLGVGTTSMVLEKIKEASEDWVKDGKIDPEQASDILNDIASRLQRQIRNVMQDLGVPRQNEMDELRGRIDRLERQLRELENKQWR
jgi:polyhydroxyalkanoate synthesis regulator phasin